MAKRPVPRYDFKAFGAAIKAAREGRKESRKKVGDEMFISPRYLANIENKGQHPSLQIFFELIQRYHISVDQFLLDTPAAKDTQRRQLDALLDDMSDTGIRIVTATAKEISEVEKEGEYDQIRLYELTLPCQSLQVRRLSQGKIGAVSAPICAFYRHSLGGFSIVSVQPCPLFSRSGSKVGQRL